MRFALALLATPLFAGPCVLDLPSEGYTSSACGPYDATPVLGEWIPDPTDVVFVDSTCVENESYLVDGMPEFNLYDGAAQGHCSDVPTIAMDPPLGACLLATVDRFNEFDVPPVFDRPATTARLLEIFSPSQIDLIEAAFELQIFGVMTTSRSKLGSAIRFGERIADPRTRLRAIMRNIIANRGVFVPPIKALGDIAVRVLRSGGKR